MAKRTSYKSEFKFKVALEAFRGDKTFDELAVQFGVAKSLISNWRNELISNGASIFNTTKKKETAPVEHKLYQKIGELNMEVDYLKKFLGSQGLL
jgi:transposase